MLPFTEWAVVLAVMFVASPFYLRQAIAAFESVDPTLTDAARTLGASPLRTFARIALPLAAGGLVAGWVLAFARGIGEFGATIVFAGNVRGETQTLTLTIYEQLEASFDVALSIGILLVVISAVRPALLQAPLVAPLELDLTDPLRTFELSCRLTRRRRDVRARRAVGRGQDDDPARGRRPAPAGARADRARRRRVARHRARGSTARPTAARSGSSSRSTRCSRT